MVRYSTMHCDVVWRGVAWRGVVWCGVTRCTIKVRMTILIKIPNPMLTLIVSMTKIVSMVAKNNCTKYSCRCRCRCRRRRRHRCSYSTRGHSHSRSHRPIGVTIVQSYSKTSAVGARSQTRTVPLPCNSALWTRPSAKPSG